MDTRVGEIAATDADRYPALSEQGRIMLEHLREHPSAPIFRNHSGHRLLPAEVAIVREAEQHALHATLDWKPGEPPGWVRDFTEHCLRNVPFYRRYGDNPRDFTHLPTISREDLGRDIAQFVPDGLPLERLIIFQTSGTTGHPLLLPSHATVAAQYLGYHKRALRRFGIELKARRGQVGVILLGLQEKCFTYVSVTPTMDDSGLAKINLHANDWRNLHDRAAYLEAMQPEVLAGDPISYAELLEIDPKISPAALLCTSMTLSPALRTALETRFHCPVLDLYSLNEAGPVAVFCARAGGHVLLQHQMYVEILDGEITLTGGFNHYLPLLRYRTGDFASLEQRGDDLVLVNFQGRPPVRFRKSTGDWVNNVDITHALRPYPLLQFTVHQAANGEIRLKYVSPHAEPATVAQALAPLLGSEVQIERVQCFEGKVVQYTSDLP